MRSQTTNSISTLKVIMMYLVVFGHSIAVFSGNGWGGIEVDTSSVLLTYVLKWLSTLHTYSFVVASGYLFALQRYGKGKYRSPRQDIKRRFSKLMVPYFAVSVVWAIPFDVILNGASISEIFRNYVLMIDPAQLWFLVMLFELYIVFYFFSDYIVKLPISIGLTLGVVVFYSRVFLAQVLPLGIFSLGNMLRYYAFFYMGLIMYSKQALIVNGKVALGLLSVYILMAVIYLGGQAPVIVNTTLQFLLSSIGCILAVKGCSFLNKVADGKLWKMIQSSSMGIYLLHQQVLYCSIRVLNVTELPIACLVLLNVCIGFGISWGLTAMLRKTRVGRLALGG